MQISIQTLLFRACLPTRQNGVENRDKAYLTKMFACYVLFISFFKIFLMQSKEIH